MKFSAFVELSVVSTQVKKVLKKCLFFLRQIHNILRASPRRARPTLPNQVRQILFNLRYVMEGKVPRVLAKAVLQNFDPSIFYEHFTKSPKVDHVHQGRGL